MSVATITNLVGLGRQGLELLKLFGGPALPAAEAILKVLQDGMEIWGTAELASATHTLKAEVLSKTEKLRRELERAAKEEE